MSEDGDLSSKDDKIVRSESPHKDEKNEVENTCTCESEICTKLIPKKYAKTNRWATHSIENPHLFVKHS